MISSAAAVAVAAVALPVPTHSQRVPFLLPTTEREEIGRLIYRCSNSAKSPSCRPLPLNSRGSGLAPPPPADHEAPREEEQRRDGKGQAARSYTIKSATRGFRGSAKANGNSPTQPCYLSHSSTQLNSTAHYVHYVPASCVLLQ